MNELSSSLGIILSEEKCVFRLSILNSVYSKESSEILTDLKIFKLWTYSVYIHIPNSTSKSFYTSARSKRTMLVQNQRLECENESP